MSIPPIPLDNIKMLEAKYILCEGKRELFGCFCALLVHAHNVCLRRWHRPSLPSRKERQNDKYQPPFTTKQPRYRRMRQCHYRKLPSWILHRVRYHFTYRMVIHSISSSDRFVHVSFIIFIHHMRPVLSWVYILLLLL